MRKYNCRSPQFSKERITLLDLDSDLPERVINHELAMLGLDRTIEVDKNFRDLLKSYFRGSMVGKLYDFVQCESRWPGLSSDKLAKKTGYSKATVNNYRKMLREKGLAYFGNGKEPLPPLKFPCT